MNLESLANELLLDLFEYFNTTDLIRAFYTLNSRFNALLFNHSLVDHLDFRSISKGHFDIICQQHLPFTIHRVISLSLFDDDETPTLPNLFLSLGFTFDQFDLLKSLTLYHIYSFDTINKIIIQCQPLPYLTCLNLLKCYLHTSGSNIPCLFNHIWSLSKLIHCNLSNTFPGLNLISTITTTCTSMKNLSLEAIPCDLNDLSNLFEYTPNLQRFRTNISSSCENQQLETIIPSIISLKIFYPNSISSILMLENMPNLRYLKMKTTNVCLNGHEWKKILVDNVPKLQVFRLKMEYKISHQHHIEKHVSELVDTFRTHFWLEKHRWFVRCQWTKMKAYQNVILYTLPYVFDKFHFIDEHCFKSTCPNDKDYWSYNCIQTLHLENANNDSYENFPQKNLRLSNIRHLKSHLSFDDKIWSCISSLNRLISLDIPLPSKHLQYYQLQKLCNRAPCLYSLKFHGLYDFQNAYMNLFLSKKTSIRRLDLLGNMNSLCNQCYNSEDCVILAKSLLGHQCEVLLIEVENRTDILYVIETMMNLRMLIFRCEYNLLTEIDFGTRLKNHELFRWFQKHVPTSCLIMRDSNLTSSYMRVWIG